jgi:hypothetical protein
MNERRATASPTLQRRRVRLAAAVVRAWTQVYTWGLARSARDARREEIESDLWESVHDPDVDRETLALQIWARLLAGVFDDVRWRAAQVIDFGPYAWRVAASLALALLLGLWLVRAATPPVLETPPAPRRLDSPVLMDPPPPPPPPPPPCAPPGFPQDPGFRCSRQ